MESITKNIQTQWATLKEQNPKLRIRDAARTLGISEAELLYTEIGANVRRLNNRFTELLDEIDTLGKVMALTRNDHCVHERKGIYKRPTFNGPIGLVVTPDIDLRLFMNYWYFGFAVNENDRYSLQFFDRNGEAVHKIYMTVDSNQKAYQKLVDKYLAENQEVELTIVPNRPPVAALPDQEINIVDFQEEWKNLKDTHDFHDLLRKYKLTRTQAMRLAPEDYAQKIPITTLKSILENISANGQEIMIFTGSKGCIQIHTGPIKHLMETGPWYNVLDPDFNMHLRLDGIADLWRVKKPTADGLVHSIEAYDANGSTIVQFFGKRKPGIPESEGWRSLLKEFIKNDSSVLE